MNDNTKRSSGDSELDAILDEVKKSKQQAEMQEKEQEPSKTWSLEDIDRLIAEENGEEYVPKPKKAPTPAEDFERILRREFDTGMFTVKPISEEKTLPPSLGFTTAPKIYSITDGESPVV